MLVLLMKPHNSVGGVISLKLGTKYFTIYDLRSQKQVILITYISHTDTENVTILIMILFLR